MELDSNCSSTIQQTLTTVTGVTYSLQFDFSPRPNAPNPSDNHVQVKWNGAVVADLTATSTSSDTQWTTYSYSVVATGTATTLSFADLGISDSYGTYIDNVRVTPVPSP